MSVVFVTTIASAPVYLASLRRALGAVLPSKTILNASEDQINPESVEVAIVASPSPGSLSEFKNLKLIASLWTGVDGLLSDTTIPRTATLVRLVDPEMTRSMTESVLMHALMAHRQIHGYSRMQRQSRWEKKPTGMMQPMASERRVGVLGIGELGTAAIRTLSAHGFPVVGWSRSPKNVESVLGKGSQQLNACTVGSPGKVTLYSGQDGFRAVLLQSEILIDLLPLTPDTRHILNKDAFDLMPKGASLINLGRGPTVVESDVIQALDSGKLDTAVLDVFAEEPLPPTNPLWSHPRVMITPHVSASPHPDTAAKITVETIRKHFAGEYPLPNTVDFTKGY